MIQEHSTAILKVEYRRIGDSKNHSMPDGMLVWLFAIHRFKQLYDPIVQFENCPQSC